MTNNRLKKDVLKLYWSTFADSSKVRIFVCYKYINSVYRYLNSEIHCARKKVNPKINCYNLAKTDKFCLNSYTRERTFGVRGKRVWCLQMSFSTTEGS